MRTIAFAVVMVAVAACATTVHKTPQATSGSKADGTVRLAYDRTVRESAIADWATAEQNALRRCQAWGYSRVEPFAGRTEQCAEMGQGLLVNGASPGLCARYIVYRDYQCLD